MTRVMQHEDSEQPTSWRLNLPGGRNLDSTRFACSADLSVLHTALIDLLAPFSATSYMLHAACVCKLQLNLSVDEL